MEPGGWRNRRSISFGPGRRIRWEIGIAGEMFWWRRPGRERQDFEFVLQMMQDLVDDGSVLDHRNNIHLCMIPGTKQGIILVDEFDQGRPVFLALLDPFTFGFFFRRLAGWCLIRRLRAFGHFSARGIRIAALVTGSLSSLRRNM